MILLIMIILLMILSTITCSTIIKLLYKSNAIMQELTYDATYNISYTNQVHDTRINIIL